MLRLLSEGVEVLALTVFTSSKAKMPFTISTNPYSTQVLIASVVLFVLTDFFLPI